MIIETWSRPSLGGQNGELCLAGSADYCGMITAMWPDRLSTPKFLGATSDKKKDSFGSCEFFICKNQKKIEMNTHKFLWLVTWPKPPGSEFRSWTRCLSRKKLSSATSAVANSPYSSSASTSLPYSRQSKAHENAQHSSGPDFSRRTGKWKVKNGKLRKNKGC